MLTRPQGSVRSTAKAGPYATVQGTEGGLVVPVAAPLLCLPLLLCGEEQSVRGQSTREPAGGFGRAWWYQWQEYVPGDRHDTAHFLPCSMTGSSQ